MNTQDEARALNRLRSMMADMEGQDPLHLPTAFWREASQRIVAELLREGFGAFRSLGSTRDFFVPCYGPPGNMLSVDLAAALEACVLAAAPSGSKTHLTVGEFLSGRAWALADYRVFLAGDRPDLLPRLDAVSESERGSPSEQHVFEGRRYSRSFLNYLHGLVFLKQVLGDVGIRSVLEVGGGFGTLGELLHKSGGAYSYVDVDIPPTAAVAAYYLQGLEGLSCAAYEDHPKQGEICVPAPGSQAVLCSWQLPRLTGSIDLLWNFISFQEMEPDVVAFYIAQARRLGARYVLLRNLREGKQRRRPGSSVGVEEPITAGDYDRLLEGFRLLATNVYPFGYRTVDGYHSELRLYERI